MAECQNCNDSEVIAHGWDFEYETTKKEFPIGKCRKCDLVFLTEVPDAGSMNTIYPENYYSFNESNSQNPIVKFVRDRLEISKVRAYQKLLENQNSNIIDVGCGDGRLLDILARHGPEGWAFSGIEIGESAAAKAKSKGYDVFSGDFESFNVNQLEKRFDLALMHQVLEHTRDPRETLKKISGILKPGGILSIETPDINAWDFRLFQKRHWGGYHIPRHFYIFNKSNLARLAKDCGYEVVSSRSILSPVFWVHSLHNYFIEKPRLKKLASCINDRNIPLLFVATAIDIIQTKIFNKSSNMQVLFRKIS